METARIIVGGRNIPINIRKDLREISLGEWDGYSHEEIEQRYPDEYRKRGEDIWNYRIPGGETFADSSDRVIPAFKEILAATSGNVLIAGHAGVNRLIICHVTGKPVRDLFQIEQEYGCLYIIKCSDSGFQLDREGTDFFFAVIVELSSSSLPV
jgi:broad specificity phosphatase PhoE